MSLTKVTCIQNYNWFDEPDEIVDCYGLRMRLHFDGDFPA